MKENKTNKNNKPNKNKKKQLSTKEFAKLRSGNFSSSNARGFSKWSAASPVRKTVTWTIIIAASIGVFSGIYQWGKSNGGSKKTLYNALAIHSDDNEALDYVNLNEHFNKDYDPKNNIKLNIRQLDPEDDMSPLIDVGTIDFAFTTHPSWLNATKIAMTDRGQSEPDRNKQIMEFFAMIEENPLEWDVAISDDEINIPVHAGTWGERASGGAHDILKLMEGDTSLQDGEPREGGTWSERLKDGSDKPNRSTFRRSQIFTNEWGTENWYKDGLRSKTNDGVHEDFNDGHESDLYLNLERPLNKFLLEDKSLEYIKIGRTFDPTGLNSNGRNGKALSIEDARGGGPGGNDYQTKQEVQDAITAGKGGDVLFAYLDGLFHKAEQYDFANQTEKTSIYDLFRLADERRKDAEFFKDEIEALPPGWSAGQKDRVYHDIENKFIYSYSSVLSSSNYISLMEVFENVFDWKEFADLKYEGDIKKAQETELYSRVHLDRENTEYMTGSAVDFYDKPAEDFITGNNWAKMEYGASLLTGNRAGYRQMPNSWARSVRWNYNNPVHEFPNFGAWIEERNAKGQEYHKDIYNNTIAISMGEIIFNPGFVVKKGTGADEKARMAGIIDYILEDEVAGPLLFGKRGVTGVTYIDDSGWIDAIMEGNV